MTKYYTNFEDSSIGYAPLGWTRRGVAATNPVWNRALVGYYGAPLVKKRQLRYFSGSGNGSGALQGGWSWDAIDGDANRNNIEVLVLVKRDTTNAARQFTLWVRADSGVANAYRCSIQFSDTSGGGNKVRLSKLVAGVATLWDTVFVFDTTKAYWLRFRVQDSGGTATLQAKTWVEGTSEPSSWTATQTDTTFVGTTGYTIITAQGGQLGSPTDAISGFFNFVSVATNGDTAFAPRSNSDYTAWLDTPARRQVLVELTATGYKSTGGDVLAGAYLSIPASMSPSAAPASTPDSVLNSPSADIDLRVDFAANSYTSAGGTQVLVSKYDGSVNQKSWMLELVDGGTLRLTTSANGSADTVAATSTAALSPAGTRLYVRATHLCNNGAAGNDVRFYTSDDGGFTWTQLGAVVTTAATTSYFNSTAKVQIGSRDVDVRLLASGKVYRAQGFQGIDGMPIFDFNPMLSAPAAGSFTGGAGETWTINTASGSSIASSYTYTAADTFYVSNGGFTSQPWDAPANQHYDAWLTKAPTITSEIGVALTGESSVGFGEFTITNPRAVANGPGVRDDWLRMKWKRNYVRVYLGDPSWAKADFRLQLLGRLGQPAAPAMESIAFPVTDLSDVLDQLLQTSKFASGPNGNRYLPVSVGAPEWIDIVEHDPSTLMYRIHDGQLYTGSGYSSAIPISDNGADVFKSFAGTACTVSTVGDTITTSSSHGFIAGYRVVFPPGSTNLPAPFVVDLEYYVLAAGLTSTAFKLGLTPGGAAIDITTVGTAANWSLTGYGYTIDYSSGLVTLLASPAGRLVAKQVKQGPTSSAWGPSAMLSWAMFSKGRIAQDFKDQSSFDALATALGSMTAGFYVALDQLTVKQACEAIAKGINGWFGPTPDGLIQVGQLGLPAATAAMSFIEGEVSGLRLASTIRAVDFSRSDISVSPPWLSRGPFIWHPALSDAQTVLKTIVASYSYGATGIPLDNHPDVGDSIVPKLFDTLITNGTHSAEQARLAAMFQTPIGVFEFATKLRASELKLGDTISLTHSRLGWQLWNSGTPASPDNTATIDSRLAVVMKKELNLSPQDPFPVKLSVYRQVPGNYPAV